MQEQAVPASTPQPRTASAGRRLARRPSVDLPGRSNLSPNGSERAEDRALHPAATFATPDRIARAGICSAGLTPSAGPGLFSTSGSGMCGRYTLKTNRKILEERFGLGEGEVLDFKPRFNLGPAQDGLVVRAGGRAGARTAGWLRWGLIPSWTRDQTGQPLLINARGENLAGKPAFRDAFRRRRCLVLADGFFEWARDGVHAKQPFYFTANHGEPFAMAGLWESWHPPGAEPDDVVETYAIITTRANAVLAPYHDRMPVILEPTFYDDWLNPLLTHPDPLEALLQPYPAMRMLARAVSSRVNSIKNDDPACIAPPESEAATGPGSGAPGTPHTGQLDFDLGL